MYKKIHIRTYMDVNFYKFQIFWSLQNDTNYKNLVKLKMKKKHKNWILFTSTKLFKNWKDMKMFYDVNVDLKCI